MITCLHNKTNKIKQPQKEQEQQQQQNNNNNNNGAIAAT